jgi:Zn finger protein HypA/HybF involved in hydrogenase expression
MAVETVCRRCEQRFEASTEDVRRGVWRVCPSCRQLEAGKDAAVIARRLAQDRKNLGTEVR